MGGQPKLDYAGRRFGRLVAIDYVESDQHGLAKWRCRCDCGSEVVVRRQALRDGGSLSCGCLMREMNRERLTTHGGSATQQYTAWRVMIERCTSPTNHKYQRYGGRGITVCERWLRYENFIADMGPRPPGATIDRKDNNGNYEPSNCRWATPKQQANNRSNNRIVEVGVEKMTFQQACDRYGVNKSCARSRLRRGWTIERTFNQG